MEIDETSATCMVGVLDYSWNQPNATYNWVYPLQPAGDKSAVINAINKAQVFNYVTKPFQPEELLAQIERAHEVKLTRIQRDLFLKRSEHLYEVSQNAVVLFNSSQFVYLD